MLCLCGRIHQNQKAYNAVSIEKAAENQNEVIQNQALGEQENLRERIHVTCTEVKFSKEDMLLRLTLHHRPLFVTAKIDSSTSCISDIL